MPASGATPVVAGGKRKLSGSEKVTELERAEGLLKRGRLTKEQFDLLVSELLPTPGGEPANATTSAAAGLLELAKKAKGAGPGAIGGAEGAAGAEGEGAQQAEEGAAAVEPLDQAAEPGAGAEEGVAAEAEEGAPGPDVPAEQQVADKRKRTSYKWKFDTHFDTKEKVRARNLCFWPGRGESCTELTRPPPHTPQAREYIKSQLQHYVLKHGKNSDIVFQCRSHIDCTHHFRIFPHVKAKQVRPRPAAPLSAIS